MKVEVNIPYPEIKVEQNNLNYADLLSQNYAGDVSETTAVFMYSYQYLITNEEYKDIAKIIEDISIVEMKHMEILGKLIKLLGKDPKYETCESTRGGCVMWSANKVNYAKDLKTILLLDIKAEKEAIRNYNNHRNIIGDRYIKDILSRIIIDEERHLEIFETLYNEVKVKENNIQNML